MRRASEWLTDHPEYRPDLIDKEVDAEAGTR